MRRFVGILAVLVLAALASVTLAKKGGGGGNPGGGEPPDYSVAYVPGTAGGNLRVMNADGSATKQLTRFGVAQFAWHADGDKLLAHCQDLNPVGIYTIDLDGNAALVLPVATAGFSGVAMSNGPTPTGDPLIAYVAPGSAGHSLFVCEPDGSNSVPLLSVSDWLGDNSGNFQTPTFHPSGNGIAVPIAEYGVLVYVIFVELGVDSGGQPIATNVTQLTGLAGTVLEDVGVFSPTFSNSGEFLAVAGGNSSTPRSLWFVDMADLTSITKLTECTNIGTWNATDTLFYYTAPSTGKGGGKKSPTYPIHTIDASGNVTNLGVGGHHVECRMP
ncbi:MAG: TolB family protein [Planctomycetota bacterium]|jgi:hypothetical protein